MELETAIALDVLPGRERAATALPDFAWVEREPIRLEDRIENPTALGECRSRLHDGTPSAV